MIDKLGQKDEEAQCTKESFLTLEDCSLELDISKILLEYSFDDGCI